jgi:hypothetical protein
MRVIGKKPIEIWGEDFVHAAQIDRTTLPGVNSATRIIIPYKHSIGRDLNGMYNSILLLSRYISNLEILKKYCRD